MKKEIGTEKQDSHLVRRKWKRVIAMILSILMVTSAIDYSGFINVSAETLGAEASVTDAGGTVTNYTTLEEAIAAAVNMSGSTVTLLTDATTETIVEVYSGTFTIDLNGKTWTGPVDDIALGLFSNAKVTLKDSGVGGNISSTRGWVLCVYSVNASLAIEGGTYTGIMNCWGTIGVLLAEGYAYRDSNGTWVSDVSSTQIANVTVQEAPVRITAQPQDTGALSNYTDTHTLSVTAVTVPATSGNDITYQWYSVGTGSGSTDEAITGATDASYTVSTGLAEGTYTYYCAITCDNYTVNTRKVEFAVSIAPGKEARVTASDGSVTDYTTLEEAITAAQGMSGSTVMLVKNVATEALMTITSGTFAIDLNGKTWNNTASTGTMALYLNGTAASQINITFKDSGTGGTFTSVKTYAIYVGSYASASIEGGTYTGIDNFVGTIGDLLAEGYVYRDSSGSVVSDLSGHTIKNVTVGEAPVRITTQPEDVVAAPDYTVSPVLNVTTETVPADSGNTISYQWYSVGTGSGGADEAISGATDASYTISTGLAEGTYTYYCAITCDGYTVNTGNAAFYVSSSTGKFSVTDSNNNTINYPSLEIAIIAAKSKPDSTVKLLENTTTASTVEVGSGTFTIDLNGMTWTSTVSAGDVALHLTYGSHVTLKDSASGGTFTSAGYATIRVMDAPLTIENGIYKNTTVSSGMPTSVLFANSWYETVTIKGGNFINNDSHGYTACLQQARVSISGGTFSGQSVYFEQCSNVSLTGGTYDNIYVYDSSVSTLLASGYGFKNVNGGTWVNNLGNNTNDLSHNYLLYATTVQLAPVQITAQPQGGEAVTYGYTSTEVPTLSVTAAKTTAAPDGSEISYQWYRVKSGTETSDTAVGMNSSTLTIPTGLDAGTHSFYCAISCDGYIVNSQSATFTVEKATPTISLDVDTREDEPYIYHYGSGIYLQAFVMGVNGEKPDGTVTFKIGDEVITTSSYDSSSESYSAGGSQYPNAGTHSFTAIYTPSTDGTGQNYVGVTSTAVERTIATADQDALSITEVTGKKYGDDAFTLTTSGGSGEGGVTYSVPENNGVLSISGSTATIIGAGTVTVTATKAADNNYNSTTTTRDITIDKADTTIAFNGSYATDYTCTGTALEVPDQLDLTITGASYKDVTFTWYQDSVVEENQLSAAPSFPGTYVIVASIPETANIHASSASKTVTISFYNQIWFVYYNDIPAPVNGSAPAPWYSGDVTITVPTFSVSDSIDGNYTPSYTLSGEGTVSKTLYFKCDNGGYITDGKTITVNMDKTAPAFSGETDGITISDNHWKQFLNQITFGHFYKETKDVSISATESGSGVDKYYYYIDTTGSTTVKTAEELDALTFTEGGSFSISDENNYIIYAYAVDVAGNKSAYICTDGIVVDKTAPDILLYDPTVIGGDIKDTSAVSTASINEKGTISYVVKTAEQSSITAQTILDDPDKKTASRTGDFPYINLYYTNLTATTTYYIYAVGTDSAGNNGNVASTSFTTSKILPVFTADPTVTGTYGQKVSEMTVSQLTSTNGIAGSWSVSSNDKPSVGTSGVYDVVFTPVDTEQYAPVTVHVIPTVNPKSLTADGVTIGDVTGTYTYDGTAKEPTVTATDSVATMTASDYEYSYSSNTDAGTATVTVTGKGNYTGTVSRTFMIDKAAAPIITFPTASEITYGQKLSEGTLTESNNQYGTFAWTKGDTVPTVANSGYEVTFTPTTATLKNYEAITDTTNIVAIAVSKATPVVTVEPAISGDVGNRQATLRVTVAKSGDGEAPTGTVTFINTTSDSDADIEGATDITLTDGTATYTWTGLANQLYKVKAVYSGSDNYNNATSTELSFDTTKQDQAALAIASIGAKAYGDVDFTLETTGGSGNGDVNFTSSDPAIVSISGTTATIHNVGTVTITATKAADNTYNEETTCIDLTIAKADLAKAVVSGIVDEKYMGKSIAQPGLAVTINGKTLTNNTDYTLTYHKNTAIGTASVTISGIGVYTGTIERNFQIYVSKGSTYTVSDMQYKITDAATSGKGTVTFVKSTKSKSKLKGTLKIGNTVMIGGISFKITAIGDKAFKGYTKLTKVMIGNNVTTIGKEAFSGCGIVTSVTIGTGLKTISANAFYNCKKLKTITISSKSLKTVSKNAIKNIYRKAVIKVPSSKVSAYKKLFKSSVGFTGTMSLKKK